MTGQNIQALMGMLFEWSAVRDGTCEICGEYSAFRMARLTVYLEPPVRDKNMSDSQYENLLDIIFDDVSAAQKQGHYDVAGIRKCCGECAMYIMSTQQIESTVVRESVAEHSATGLRVFSALVSIYIPGERAKHQVLLVSGQGEADKAAILRSVKMGGFQSKSKVVEYRPYSEN